VNQAKTNKSRLDERITDENGSLKIRPPAPGEGFALKAKRFFHV
jgi:hypothetical protein